MRGCARRCPRRGADQLREQEQELNIAAAVAEVGDAYVAPDSGRWGMGWSA